MIARLHIRQLVVALLAACALAAGGIYWYRLRHTGQPASLVSYLPAANASVMYVDVDALRRSGILATLAGPKAVEDADYQQFVRDTKFDYRQDLDAVAGAFKDGRVYFALAGRFHWNNLSDYAIRQGGSCHNNYCVLAGSQPNRRISFYPLTSRVLAMAIAPDDFAAYQIAKPTGKPSSLAASSEPVWALIPAGALQSMDSLPTAAKAFVPALQGAEQIVFSIGADHDRQLELGVHVTCKDAPAASALLTQLQSVTKSLRDLFAREHQSPNPADLSGLLVAGTFHLNDRQVYGEWAIPKAFMDAIAGGTY